MLTTPYRRSGMGMIKKFGGALWKSSNTAAK
jgi:hypothetical protein